jgi:hypothetical protein
MSKDSIRLSPKHGLNPSIAVCFWCHQPIGVALAGKIDREDSEAPHYTITDYEPCDECKAKMNTGISFIGVMTEQPEDNRPPIMKNYPNPDTNEPCDIYPTGSLAVLREEAVDHIIASPEVADNLKRTRKCFCPDKVVRNILAACYGKEDGDDNENID